MENLIDIKSLILSFIIGVLIAYSFNIYTHPIYISLIISGIYVLLLLLKYKNIKKQDSNNNLNINLSNNHRMKKGNKKSNSQNNDSFTDYSDIDKTNGYFDGLKINELSDKLNYLYYATSHPFKPISYNNYIKNVKRYSENDTKSPKSLKHIRISKDQYPNLSQDQINYNDCMNHISGNLLSCDQGNNIHASLLTDGIVSKKDLNQVIREDFKAPLDKLECSNSNDILYKNAPYQVKANCPKDYSSDLCSNCIVQEEEPGLDDEVWASSLARAESINSTIAEMKAA